MRRSSVTSSILLSVFFCGSLRAVPVTNGLQLWLDASDASTLFKNSALTMPAAVGDDIAGWKDKSGNNHHAIQDDSFLRPSWEATAMNGQPAVRFFGGEGDGMAIDESLILERPYTAFIVNQYHDAGFRGRTLQGLDANWLHGLWSARFASYADGFVGSVPAEVGFPYVADTTGDFGGSSTFFVNGVDFTTNDTPAGVPGRLGLVSVGMFPGEVSDADVSEVVIYDRILSNNELTQVRDFLYTKYKAEPLDDLVATPQNTVLKGTIGTFTGGDPGDGLDLQGNFAYALNVGGRGNLKIGDANFTNGSAAGSTPGAAIDAVNEISAWHTAEYGETLNDDNLETVIQSIRWSPAPTPVTVDLDVQAGTSYRLQLLFAESCCDRGYDIKVEDELVVDNLNVQLAQEGINNGSQGVHYTLDLVATDSQLNISLEGINLLAPDNNPILNCVTLEIGGGPLPGDFNGNGSLDAGDIDQLSAAIRGGTTDRLYDLDANNVIDHKDRTVWVEQLKRTYFGDSNLDGEFSNADFVQVFQAGKYEDATIGNANWSQGDWDGNGDFESSDFVLSFQGGGYEKGPRAGVAAVPEPSGIVIALIGLLYGCLRTRRGNRE